ncbi:MAG: hypothetical protein IT265_00005, partial [Saprospiraceae bacterium]|nr:hypothetical protein [Saprospiraceae bacterium]
MRTLILFLVLFNISFSKAQTNYEDDSRSWSIRLLVLKSVDFGNLCGAQLDKKSISEPSFDSIQTQLVEIENGLKEFWYNSRYRALRGLCYMYYGRRLAEVYRIHGDSIKSNETLFILLNWIEEVYNDEYFPISVAGASDTELLNFSLQNLRDQIIHSMYVIMDRTYTSKDAVNFDRTVGLFFKLNFDNTASNEDVEQLYFWRLQTMKDLNRKIDVRLDWIREMMLFLNRTGGKYGNWKVIDNDASLIFYDAILEFNKTGSKNRLRDLIFASKTLIDMGHKTEPENLYSMAIKQNNPMDIDTALIIYDYFYKSGDIKSARNALDCVRVDWLGCVNLSILAYSYRQLGDIEKADKLYDEYKKCMREHKRYERKQKRSDMFDVFDWVPEFWKEKVNVAFSVNPLAGLNTKSGRTGGLYKFVPLSADVRTGVFFHEFRWNYFINYNGSERFTRGNLVEPKIENEIRNEWISLKGNDFSYYLGIVAKRTEDEGYDSRWSGFHSFGFQYLWGNFNAAEEQTSVVIKGNLNTQDLKIRPEIYRKEYLVNWKYSRFYKRVFYYTIFTGFGIGWRNITYNSQTPGIGDDQLNKSDETTFFDARLIHENWLGPKLTFRAG